MPNIDDITAWTVGSQETCVIVFLDSMIVNDIFRNLGRPNMFLIWYLWSSMISCKASVAQICFLFGLYERQWSRTKPWSPKKSIKFVSMIVNDLSHNLGRLKMYRVWSSRLFMIVNDLFQRLGGPNMLLFGFYDHLWSIKKPLSHKYVFLFGLYDRQWSLAKPS